LFFFDHREGLTAIRSWIKLIAIIFTILLVYRIGKENFCLNGKH